MSNTTGVVRMDGPVLVFGGPYGNLQATRAVLNAAQRFGIPPDRIVCTGDLVAYCGDPVATISLVRDSGVHVVMGNCDEQLGAGGGDCGCGFPSGSTCERLSAAWFAHADAQVSGDDRRWLAQLPARIDLEIGGRRLAVVHGGVNVINRFVFASTPPLVKARELAVADCDGVIGGHCGLPFTQVIDGRLWHNAGVVGMPAHDGTPRGWFSILEPTADGLGITHHALDYDHRAAAQAMRQAGLPPDYETALSTGIWPSCDVLPKREIRSAGVPLQPGTVMWRGIGRAVSGRRGRDAVSVLQLWPAVDRDRAKPLDPAKFRDPMLTAKGEPRAAVALTSLDTLWFNTGTLCNITCANCYIESSPKNDRLVYLTLDDVTGYLDEIKAERLGTREIGFTGGEPFMNPDMVAMLEVCLSRGFDVLVLTNAMRPMMRHKTKLAALGKAWGDRLKLRVSLDHFTSDRHEEERGVDTFAPALAGLAWLARSGLSVAVAGRTMWGETEASARLGYARLFRAHDIAIDGDDRMRLVLFPEMDDTVDVPEISTGCWRVLAKSPDDMMCASSRMVVRRKGADKTAVLACTLLPYDPQFELGPTLKHAARPVRLNHAHCAKFCVLGGASCAAAGNGDASPGSGPTSREHGREAEGNQPVAAA